MKLVALDQELEFVPVKLILHQSGLTDLFAAKNNKTLAETLGSKKYSQLSPEVRRRYPDALNEKLGAFLYRLKMSGDEYYLRFLNPYGDRTYCEFSISEYLNAKGLYTYVVAGEVRYIGRSHDPFGRRINQGYGHLSPKNCYRDGQSTNCHLNSLIAEHWTWITFHVCPWEDDDEINAFERALIRKLRPVWNTALKSSR